MKIICLSASNTKTMDEQSTSTKVCQLLKEMMKEEDATIDVEVVALLHYNLIPCTFCGLCAINGNCPFDSDFNKVYQKIVDSDALFIVSPYYSIVPVKLTMIMEKMNEIFYASWINDNHFIPLIADKPCGIIGHGGMTQNKQSLQYYHTNLITPIANTLRGFGVKIVKPNDDYPNGIPFGLDSEDCIKKNDSKVFPDIIQNYDLISTTIKPLLKALIEQLMIAHTN